VLDDYVAAAQATYRAAQGQPLPKEQLRAGIKQHRAVLVAERTGRALLPALAGPVRTLLDYFDDWIKEEQKYRYAPVANSAPTPSGRTGPCARSWPTATQRGQPLSFEGLNRGFYNGLRNYMLGTASRSPRTFNTLVAGGVDYSLADFSSAFIRSISSINSIRTKSDKLIPLLLATRFPS
jgi:hypothetical protein